MTFPEVDTIDTYGGALDDYASVTDPTTDRAAAAANKAYASVAAMTHGAVKAWLRVTTNATTGTMVLVTHDAAWGNAALYAPVLARSGTGVFTLTWPTSVLNELGVTYSTNFRGVLCPNPSGSTCVHGQAVVTSANVVTLYTFDAAGAANDCAGVTWLVAVL